MASKERQFQPKLEYSTNKRTSTLASHLDRYLRWGFSDDSDNKFHKILIQVDSDISSDMRDYVGHIAEIDPEKKVDHARDGRQNEHQIEREMITDVQTNKFNMTDSSARFHSDSRNDNNALIRITIAEAPKTHDFVPGSQLAGLDKDGKAKDSKSEIDKIRKMIEKEVKHEVGDEVTNLDVHAQWRTGSKIVGRLTYHDNEPVYAKYNFAVFVVSFTWNEQPSLKVDNATKFNYKQKTGKSGAIFETQYNDIIKDIKEISSSSGLSIQQIIDMLDNELQ